MHNDKDVKRDVMCMSNVDLVVINVSYAVEKCISQKQ